MIFVDRMFKFSDNYITSQKLEQVEKIEKLIESGKVDSTVKRQLRTIELAVLQRQTAWGYLSSQLAALKAKIVSSGSNSEASSTGSGDGRSFFWHTISSSWLLIIIIVIMPIVILIQNKVDLSTIAAVVFAILATIPFIFGFSALFAQVPILFGKPVLNYILNAVLHFFILFIIVKLVEASKKRRVSSK